ncbi:MAG: hypothetical protein AB7N91_18665 [Candidatus Tectimicrobiota bacterium]
MKRWIAAGLMSMLVMLSASLALAQQGAQPVVRMGNWIEVGNELFMHVIGNLDINYRTSQNYDFESRIRDRVNTRNITSSTNHEGSSDVHWAEIRLGADWRYQKSLTAQVLFEQQFTVDGSTVDAGNINASNPGGTDIFGNGTTTENPVFHVERYWIDYKFQGTPFRMRVGADLWRLDQAALVNDDDPRFAVFADFGQFNVMAAAVVELESQRVGLTNDNDLIYYTFSGGVNFKPHRVQLDVVYSRDRWSGADTQAGAVTGFRGQKLDAVNVSGSWTGTIGPIKGLVQGMVATGTARGGTGLGLPAGVQPGRDYDILSFGAIAQIEVDLGIARPFVGVLFASGDGDPNDNDLKGFNHLGFRSSGTGTTGDVFRALEVSPAAGGHRDYFCPGGMTGANGSIRPGGGNTAIGNTVFSGVTECGHTIDNPFNDRIGGRSHPGLESVYSNPGALLIPVGVALFPVKGHEFRGYYLYKQFVSTALLEAAYNLPRGSIDKTQVHEIGGFWQWTLNPHFDIRLSGSAGFAGSGYKDLARLADCNATTAGVQPCEGEDVALQGQARFRARF